MDSHSFTVEQPVRNVAELEDRVIVLMKGYEYPDDDPNRELNVVCYSKSGRFLWRIEDLGAMDPDLGENPFTSIRVDEVQGTIVVRYFEGLRYDLDPETGRLSNAVITR